jgi:Response regulator of the LytR/AlgR family
VVVFSFLFLLSYHPFSSTIWLGLKPDVVLPTVLFYLSGIGVLLLSKIGLMIYQIRHTITVRKYLLWFLVEFILIAVIYLLFTRRLFETDIPFTFRLVLHTSLCVGMILVIPYTIFTLLAANKAKTEELDALKLQLATENPVPERSDHIIHFYDFGGVLRISIPAKAIYYIASQDNYVEIQYVLEGKLLNYLMRCRTARLEKQLEGTSLIRCHRSYIVNVDNVSQFKREKSRAFLVLTHPDAKRIPVSKSYYKAIAERLGHIAS